VEFSEKEQLYNSNCTQMTLSAENEIFRALRKASESHLHEIIQQCGTLLKVNPTKNEQVLQPAAVINDEHQNVTEFLLRRLKDHTHIGHRYRNSDSKKYLSKKKSQKSYPLKRLTMKTF
jgi:hypothetical protein